MLSLAVMILAALVLGYSFEDSIRLPECLQGCTLLSVGRLRLGVWIYRPRHAYVRVGVT